MRVGISLLNFRQGKVGGIETYIRKVIEHAPVLAGDDEVVFFAHRDVADLLPAGVEAVITDWPLWKMDACRFLEAFTPWRARSVERMIEASGIDVMFFTQQSMFPFHCPVPSLLFVADVQYLFSPHYFSWFDRQFRKQTYVPSIAACTKITTISEFTAGHLVERCGVSRDKIKVIPHGYDPVCREEGELPPLVDAPYLYYPAATYPHKGHARLLRSFSQLKRDGRLTHKLVFSGSQTPYWKKLKRIIRDEGLQGDVVHCGFVSSGEVAALYQHADAVVFPSEFEGFGIPVLEAVQMGKKIICSSLSIFDELGVPAEWQIDFSDPQQLLDSLLCMEGAGLDKGPITWVEAIHQTLQCLRDSF